MTVSSTRRRPAIVLGLALLALLAAAFLWGAAIDRERGSYRVVGNGSGAWSRTRTAVDGPLAATGSALFAASLAGAAAFVWPASALRRAVLVTSVAGLALLGVVAPFRLRSMDPFASSVSFERLDDLVAVLAAGGVECGEVGTGPRDGVVCRVEWPVAVDGFDDVRLENRAERAEWLDGAVGTNPIAVIGADWVARCEFNAMCARVQAATGGKFVR
jgi:hypothetical protein